MTKKRNLVKIKKSGFKKKKVVARRKKLRKIGPSCRKHDEEEEWVPRHTQQRRIGRSIRKTNGGARNPKPMHAVK